MRSSAPAAGHTVGVDSVTVGIPSWNGRQHLEACLAALEQQHSPGVEWNVVVFDNASSDGTAPWIDRHHPRVRVLTSECNVGFAAACNQIAAASDADALVLLNNDTRPEPEWLASLVDCLRAAPDDVAAVAGQVVDWSGECVDFAGGVMTFDGHAFQRDFGRPRAATEVPENESELAFASGSNMIVRRAPFLELGAFDANYFAYLEDVDFGWRARAAGHRILFAADAIVRHRGAATSSGLGNARRGFLLERNAFMTAYKNYDADLWPRMMPAILNTLISRATGCLTRDTGPDSWLLRDPIATSGSAEHDDAPGWLRRLGNRLAGETAIRPGAQTEAHLRAMTHVIRDMDRYATRRAAVQARRRRSDREILAEFPPHVIPTYPGDRELFESSAFRASLPAELPFAYCQLDEIMQWP